MEPRKSALEDDFEEEEEEEDKDDDDDEAMAAADSDKASIFNLLQKSIFTSLASF